jgi:hypothetical protein
LATIFPWLSKQAVQYQQYSCRKLHIEYIPIVATNTQGIAAIIPEYNAYAAQPTTETQAYDNVGAVEMSCWAPFTCKLDTKAMHALGPRKFVRANNVAGDLKTYDVARVFLCTNNQVTSVIDETAVGKVWIDYEFEFFLPQNEPMEGSGVGERSSHYRNDALQSVPDSTPTQILFGANTDPLSFGNLATGTCQPAAGVYNITLVVTCEAGAIEDFAASINLLIDGNPSSANSAFRTSIPATAALPTMQCLTLSSQHAFNGSQTFSAMIRPVTNTAVNAVIPLGCAQLAITLA